MPYTAAQLTTIYTNIHAGLAPNAAQLALINAYAAQNTAGTLTDAQTLQNVIDTADADSAVAIQAYQFFTGTAPSAAGLAYLVNSAANPTDLNDAYYQNFNLTNRYINFAANLGTGTGAGAVSFQAAYGALTVPQAVDLAYETVIGTANAQAAGIDVTAAKAYITSQLPYFTALANQNFPNATAAQRDLVIKSEIVGYIMSAAIQANVGAYSAATSALLADLGPDNTATLGADLLASYAATTVTLTAFPDTKSANVFNAPRAFTPGGNDQVNTLNDDDVLTGVGTNPTLNFTFVNDVDSGDNYILPTMTNVQTVNVAFAIDGGGQLDLEDSTGVKAVNITRISGQAPLAGVVNMTTIPTLSITNSQAPTGNVALTFLQSTVAGAADATTLTLSNVNIGGRLYIQQTGPSVAVQNTGLTDGIESLTIVSTGSANTIGVLEAEDLKTLTLTGGQKLTLGTTGTDVNGGIVGLVEATRYGAGLANVAGSLAVIDASAMTASLDIALGSEANTTLDDTSGTPLNLKVTGGSGNDTFRLTLGANPTVGATIDGGAGTDTLQVYASGAVTLTKGAFTNLEGLDIRSGQDDLAGADTVTVDTSLFAGLTGVTLRNEGMTLTGSPIAGQWTSVAEAATFTLTKMSAASAANITILHGTTNNNAIGSSTVVASLATDTASDTVGVNIKDGVNNDPRFNFTLTAGTAVGGTNVVENITINDVDTESNAVLLTNYLAHTGTITLTGGQAGNYLDLDVTANGMRKDLSGLAADGKGWVDPGAGAAERLVATSIAAGTFTGDVIVRVGNPAGAAGAQSIVTGSGNDTVIFDSIAGVGQSTAGLSISDTVTAGTGNDTLAIDGNGTLINISASEWTNVTGFETLRLIGNGGGIGNAGALGTNQYNITLTNAFVTANNTTTAGISRIAIINDNDPTNDATGVSTSAGSSPNAGVTIDARTLDATHSFSYNGDEVNVTSDRFIMSDANINGAAIIDGGYTAFGGHAPNLDVLEVRDAAVVTIGDLANVKNVGTLEFTNDTATTQSSVLQLDTATVDALVNSTAAATTTATETLNINILGNPVLVGATTDVAIDVSSLDTTKTLLNITTNANGTWHYVFNAADTGSTFTGSAFNDVITGGAGNDTLNGGAGNDTINGGGGNDTITGGAGADTLTGGTGNDTFVYAAGTTDTVAAAASSAGVDRITDINFGTGVVGGRVDAIDLTVAVASVGTAISGAVNEATFVANINTLVTTAGSGFVTTAAGIDAALVTATSGTDAGHTYLVVDLDASDTFTAADFIVDVTGFTGTLDVSDFV